MDTASRLRPIDGIITAPPFHWVGDGFRVAGYFSAIPGAHKKLDPFLMLDYHPEHTYDPAPHKRGVGVHPHRGFETVTFAWKGSVAHHDSAGNSGIIGPGDVQWMTAGSGILHKEYHEENFSRTGGPFQMVQLWVNLPRAHKMTKPKYQALVAGQMGLATFPGAKVRVIAGAYAGQNGAVARGPARTFSPMNIYDVTMSKDGHIDLEFPGHHTVAILVMKGQLDVGGQAAKSDDFILFQREEGLISLTASADAQMLVLAGEPLGDPIASYGPFVMNTPAEIQQAFADFQTGKFGHLED